MQPNCTACAGRSARPGPERRSGLIATVQNRRFDEGSCQTRRNRKAGTEADATPDSRAGHEDQPLTPDDELVDRRVHAR